MKTQNEVARSACGSTVAIDKRMYVVQAPKHKGSQYDGISLAPISIDEIDEIFHQRSNPEMLRRRVASNFDLAWPVFSGVRMEARYRVEIQCFNHVRRKKRPPDIVSGLHDRMQKIILPGAVRNGQRLINRMIFAFAG
jgi:hypothetical protein